MAEPLKVRQNQQITNRDRESGVNTNSKEWVPPGLAVGERLSRFNAWINSHPILRRIQKTYDNLDN